MPESITLPPRPEMVRVAREAVLALLGVCPRADDVAAVTSELVTNALLHARAGALQLNVESAPGRARLEVVDGGARTAARRRLAAEDDENGRGLVIVHHLADDWGHDIGPDREVRWATFAWDADA